MRSDARPESDAAAEADDLVVRAKRDRVAFSQLYERYYAPVAKYCLRRLFVRTVAEDVLSEVFLHVAGHLPTFPGRTDSDFRRWVFRIATNAINAFLRQSQRRQELFEAAARSGQWNHDAAAQSSLTEDQNLDWPAVYRELLDLDERDRTIVMLRFFSDCSYAEIADVVDSTPGAIRTALSRVLTRLRQKFRYASSPDSTLGSPPTG